MAVAGIVAGVAGFQGCSKPPASGPATTQATTKPDPLAKIHAKIDDGIALLEAGKNGEAMQMLVKPDLVKQWQSEKEFERMVGEFVSAGKDKALLAALKKAKGQTPKLSDDKTTAEFPHAGEENPLVFEEIEGQWYLRN
jgi:hypothetical protein